MKSRTSSCNLTVLKKDITRFAPAWILYTVFLLLCLLMMTEDEFYWFVRNVSDSMQLTVASNLIYALVTAQLLFGDLFNTRMCNALHAMPLRRESWFGIHVTAGFLFAIVPYLLMSVIGMLLLQEFWTVGLVWLAAAVGQYVVFFGIAVLSVMCAGNRFAMVVVYGLINFFTVIVYWMIANLYEPLLFGISLDLDWFTMFLPATALIGDVGYLDITREYREHLQTYEITDISFGEGWHIFGIYIALGILALYLALRLYRRRKLEVAGDFIAIRALEPVFLILYTLSAGNACQILCELFGYRNNYYVFLAAGLAVGFFTGQMLLKRTIRVFEPKAFIHFAAIGAVVAATIGLTVLDPVGITRWVPEAEEVQSVTVWGSSYKGEYEPHITLENKADIEQIMNIHANAIEARMTDADVVEAVRADMVIIDKEATTTAQTAERIPVNNGAYMSITIEYTLENGKTADRHYYIFTLDPDGKTLQNYFSTPEAVFAMYGMTMDQFLEQMVAANVSDTYLTGGDMRDLMEALLKDCAAGTMAQPWDYHEHEDTAYWISFEYKEDIAAANMRSYWEVRVYESCENSYRWLQDQGILSEQQRYS